jgi:beta-lactamase class A
MLAALAPLALLPASKPVDLAPLQKRLDAVCRAFHGRMGYSLIVLKTGQRISFRGDERFPTASTIKTAVMVEAVNRVDEGTLKWSDKRPVPPESGREASMWSYFFKDGVAPDLDGWVNLMIGVSDNTATIVLREWLGIEAINARMERLGLTNTMVLGPVPPEKQRLFRLRSMFGLGVTTPNEMARLLELIYRGKAASPGGCEKMIRILGRQYWDDLIGATVPPDVKTALKSGAISRSRSDTGIVFSDNPYVLCVYTDNQKDRRWAPDNEGEVAIRKIAQMVWAHLHPHRPYSPPPSYKPFEPTGGGV